MTVDASIGELTTDVGRMRLPDSGLGVAPLAQAGPEFISVCGVVAMAVQALSPTPRRNFFGTSAVTTALMPVMRTMTRKLSLPAFSIMPTCPEKFPSVIITVSLISSPGGLSPAFGKYSFRVSAPTRARSMNVIISVSEMMAGLFSPVRYE